MLNIFTKKDGENIEVDYTPKTTIRKTFKIIVQELTITEKEELERKYINLSTKEIISDYAYRYEIGEERQKDFTSINLPTGVKKEEVRTTNIYEQTKDGLEVSDLSVYINRVK